MILIINSNNKQHESKHIHLSDSPAPSGRPVLFLLFHPSGSRAGGGDDTDVWDGSDVSVIKNEGGSYGDSKDRPILIASGAELAYLARELNKMGRLNVSVNGQPYWIDVFNLFGVYFALSKNIDLNGINWTPIGNKTGRYFNGHFDGRGHIVSGLTSVHDITSEGVSEYNFAGLFGHVSNGTIQNLGVELHSKGIDLTVDKGVPHAGGIAGRLSGTMDGIAVIRNCYVTGDGAVKATAPGGSAYAGGITGIGNPGGESSVILIHCYITVGTEATGNVSSSAGGIAGMMSSGCSYAYSTGNVEAKGEGFRRAGGISGYGGGTVSNNLALNRNITGTELYRVCDRVTSSCYASTRTKVNNSTVRNENPSSKNGADTWLETYEADLKRSPAGDDNGWAKAWTFTGGNLP